MTTPTIEDALADPSGVGRLAPAPPTPVVESRVRAAGFDVFVVDGGAASDKAGALAAIASAGGFPDWFGGNLDALVDCLRDLSWRPGDEHVAVVAGAARLAAAAPTVVDTMAVVAGDGGGFRLLLLD